MSKAASLAGFATAISPPSDLTVGIITATTVNATTINGAVSGTATGLSGTPDITVRNITGVAVTFSGNVSIGGTLTYEDVTNVDSVGLITARSGINVSGGSLVIDSGDINVSGVVTATSFIGDGSGLTSLDAGDISSGTLAIARGGTNSTATATAGGAAYGTGTAFAFTSAGTSGQVLTSNGTSAPTWADASGGAWEFISSVTASNSASVAFTSGIDDTYDVYIVIGTGIVPATDGPYGQAQLSDNNGSTYFTTGYSNNGSAWTDNFMTFLDNTGNAAGESATFEMRFYNLRSSYHKLANRIWNTVGTTGNPSIFYNGCGLQTTNAINAIKFAFSSGNISTGTFRLYGIKNS